MRSVLKNTLKNAIRSIGFDLSRYDANTRGQCPYSDMKYFLGHLDSQTILDVGANVGQTIGKMRKIFPNSIIHSFEPSPKTYSQLSASCKGKSGVHVWNHGVGSSRGTLPFLENVASDMSSFLAPTELAWGEIRETTNVEVITLDDFTKEKDIEYVHVLKSDTQGYDFEVFKGAERLIEEGKIGLIYFEFIFSRMYEHLPVFDEVFRFLTQRGYSLVNMYDPHFQEDVLSWADLLFVNTVSYKRKFEKVSAG